MRIKARTTIAGAGWAAFPGQVVDVPREEAQSIVDAGYAEIVRTSTVRTAEAPAPAVAEVAPEPEAPEGKPKPKRRGRARR